jgi:hypothetical protein
VLIEMLIDKISKLAREFGNDVGAELLATDYADLR